MVSQASKRAHPGGGPQSITNAPSPPARGVESRGTTLLQPPEAALPAGNGANPFRPTDVVQAENSGTSHTRVSPTGSQRPPALWRREVPSFFPSWSFRLFNSDILRGVSGFVKGWGKISRFCPPGCRRRELGEGAGAQRNKSFASLMRPNVAAGIRSRTPGGAAHGAKCSWKIGERAKTGSERAFDAKRQTASFSRKPTVAGNGLRYCLGRGEPARPGAGPYAPSPGWTAVLGNAPGSARIAGKQADIQVLSYALFSLTNFDRALTIRIQSLTILELLWKG